MPRIWELEKKITRLQSGPFRIEEKMFRSPRTGRSHAFITATGSDWVNVVALTPSNQMVFVRQFRHGREVMTLEIPGGLVDAGESPRRAAVRELSEETGYRGDDPVSLGTILPNPAILDLACHTFLVTGATRVCEPRLDDSEDIEVVLVPMEEVGAMVATGRIDHALVLAAFLQLEITTGMSIHSR